MTMKSIHIFAVFLFSIEHRSRTLHTLHTYNHTFTFLSATLPELHNIRIKNNQADLSPTVKSIRRKRRKNTPPSNSTTKTNLAKLTKFILWKFLQVLPKMLQIYFIFIFVWIHLRFHKFWWISGKQTLFTSNFQSSSISIIHLYWWANKQQQQHFSTYGLLWVMWHKIKTKTKTKIKINFIIFLTHQKPIISINFSDFN